MKYLLIEVIEIEISPPTIFDKYEDAFYEMRKRLAKSLNLKVEEIGQEESAYLAKYSAWVDGSGKLNMDWKICKIPSSSIQTPTSP